MFQVLSPRSRSVTLFGYSLSGNLDVDNNLYPDLAVGSLSDTVFVYRYFIRLKHMEMETVHIWFKFEYLFHRRGVLFFLFSVS